MTDRPRLIEVAFPLKQTSLDSVHEKTVRHGHISTLHIWPARRPLAACRAALIATLLSDPGDKEDRDVRLAHAGQVHGDGQRDQLVPHGERESGGDGDGRAGEDLAAGDPQVSREKGALMGAPGLRYADCHVRAGVRGSAGLAHNRDLAVRNANCENQHTTVILSAVGQQRPGADLNAARRRRMIKSRPGANWPAFKPVSCSPRIRASRPSL